MLYCVACPVIISHRILLPTFPIVFDRVNYLSQVKSWSYRISSIWLRMKQWAFVRFLNLNPNLHSKPKTSSCICFSRTLACQIWSSGDMLWTCRICWYIVNKSTLRRSLLYLQESILIISWMSELSSTITDQRNIVQCRTIWKKLISQIVDFHSPQDEGVEKDAG